MTEDQDDGSDRATTTGRLPILIPFPKTEARPWAGRRLVVVAGLLLVAVGVIALGIKLIGSDDDVATGFYVPGPLPSGWEMTGLSIISNDGETSAIRCPCDVTETRQDDADGGYVAWTSADRPFASNGIDRPRELLDDRSGWYEEDGGIGTVVWQTANGSRGISSPSLGRAELIDLADTWTSDEPPVLDGHQVTHTWHRDQPVEQEHSLIWTFTNAEAEQNLSVTMGPQMLGSGFLATSTVTLPGNGMTLGLVDDDPEGLSATASWPGNTQIFAMTLSVMAFNDELPDDYQTTPPPDWATVQDILGSFELADASTWADYLTSAPIGQIDPEAEPQDFDVLRTETIDDWLEGPEPGTDVPERKVVVTHADPDDPSAAITVESNMEFVQVPVGEPFTVDLTMTNDTGAPIDLNDPAGGNGLRGCPFGSGNWSIIDQNGLQTLAGAAAVDCAGELEPWVSGETLTRTFDFPGIGQMPEKGPIAVVIDLGDVTVVVPGNIGG